MRRYINGFIKVYQHNQNTIKANFVSIFVTKMFSPSQQNEYISQFNFNYSPPPHKKGLCIFININKGRIHSEEDVARAYNTFTGLDYEVEVYRDVSRLQLYDILEKVRVKLNSQVVAYESLVVIVGAHGDAEGMQMYDGERVRAEEIVTPFLPRRRIVRES